jgi:hypothetical protein
MKHYLFWVTLSGADAFEAACDANWFSTVVHEITLLHEITFRPKI